MKRLAFLLIILVMLFAACTNDSSQVEIVKQSPTPSASSEVSVQQTPKISGEVSPTASTQQTNAALDSSSDYLLNMQDVRLVYLGTGNEFAGNQTFVDYLDADVLQMREDNTGSTVVYVLKVEEGALKKVYQKGETYYRYSYIGMTNTDEILIKEPIAQGTSWALSDGAVRSITATELELNTAAGTYNVIEVTTQAADYTQKDYYAKNIGLVKSEFIAGGETITTELEQIQQNTPLTQTVRFYYPEFEQDRLAYIDRQVELLTNQDVNAAFAQQLKMIPDGSALSPVLTSSAAIQSIQLDEAQGILTVDLSSEFATEMNAGAMFESMLVQSLVNTFGAYFQTEKVVITLDGALYESGHIALMEGDYFTVDVSGAVEYAS